MTHFDERTCQSYNGPGNQALGNIHAGFNSMFERNGLTAARVNANWLPCNNLYVAFCDQHGFTACSFQLFTSI